MFFPTIIAVNKQTGELTVGIDAYKPAVRKFSNIVQPIRPTNKVDKVRLSNISKYIVRAQKKVIIFRVNSQYILLISLENMFLHT